MRDWEETFKEYEPTLVELQHLAKERLIARCSRYLPSSEELVFVKNRLPYDLERRKIHRDGKNIPLSEYFSGEMFESIQLAAEERRTVGVKKQGDLWEGGSWDDLKKCIDEKVSGRDRDGQISEGVLFSLVSGRCELFFIIFEYFSELPEIYLLPPTVNLCEYAGVHYLNLGTEKVNELNNIFLLWSLCSVFLDWQKWQQREDNNIVKEENVAPPPLHPAQMGENVPYPDPPLLFFFGNDMRFFRKTTANILMTLGLQDHCIGNVIRYHELSDQEVQEVDEGSSPSKLCSCLSVRGTEDDLGQVVTLPLRCLATNAKNAWRFLELPKKRKLEAPSDKRSKKTISRDEVVD